MSTPRRFPGIGLRILQNCALQSEGLTAGELIRRINSSEGPGPCRTAIRELIDYGFLDRLADGRLVPTREGLRVLRERAGFSQRQSLYWVVSELPKANASLLSILTDGDAVMEDERWELKGDKEAGTIEADLFRDRVYLESLGEYALTMDGLTEALAEVKKRLQARGRTKGG